MESSKRNEGVVKMMTRKHFKELAEIMQINKADPLIIRDIANFCASQNPRFDRSKFYDVSFKDVVE